MAIELKQVTLSDAAEIAKRIVLDYLKSNKGGMDDTHCEVFPEITLVSRETGLPTVFKYGIHWAFNQEKFDEHYDLQGYGIQFLAYLLQVFRVKRVHKGGRPDDYSLTVTDANEERLKEFLSSYLDDHRKNNTTLYVPSGKTGNGTDYADFLLHAIKKKILSWSNFTVMH